MPPPAASGLFREVIILGRVDDSEVSLLSFLFQYLFIFSHNTSFAPAIVEVKGVHQFDWLTRENVPVLEAVESHNGVRNYYHGNHVAGANLTETTPWRFASKLQSRSPKYITLLNHLRIYIPENLTYYMGEQQDGWRLQESCIQSLRCCHHYACPHSTSGY